jgi:hypothetical protein
MTLLGIKVTKVNWVLGELVSVSRQGQIAGSGDVLIDLKVGQILRDPLKADIKTKKCAYFGFGKVLCLTEEQKRFALYLPIDSDLSQAVSIGVIGDIISPYKYRFEDNKNGTLDKGLVIACRKIGDFEVGCQSGEVNS